MLSIRTAQAGLVAHIWKSLCSEIGAERARAIVGNAILADARQAGEAFARLAPQGPSLEHFATVLARWQEGNALEIMEIDLTPPNLSFRVTRCGYAEAYAEMGLDPELGHILSCARDEAFAAGYSPLLVMHRPQTIMASAPCCIFTFTWKEQTSQCR